MSEEIVENSKLPPEAQSKNLDLSPAIENIWLGWVMLVIWILFALYRVSRGLFQLIFHLMCYKNEPHDKKEVVWYKLHCLLFLDSMAGVLAFVAFNFALTFKEKSFSRELKTWILLSISGCLVAVSYSTLKLKYKLNQNILQKTLEELEKECPSDTNEEEKESIEAKIPFYMVDLRLLSG